MNTRASTIDSHAAPAHTDRNCTTATATDGATGSELEEAVVTCICRRDRDNGRTFLTDTLDRDRGQHCALTKRTQSINSAQWPNISVK